MSGGASERRRRLWVPGIRLLRILWRIMLPLAVGLFVAAVARVLDLSPAYRRQADVILLFLLGYGVLWAVVLEILSPVRPELRLVHLPDYRAVRLAVILKWLLLLLLGGELAIYLVEANDAHPSVADLLRLTRNAGLILLAWLGISRSGVLRRLVPVGDKSRWGPTLTLIVRVVIPLGVLVALAFVAIRALGYLGLARWVAARAGWTILAVALVVIVHRRIGLWLRAIFRFMQEGGREDDEAQAPPEGDDEPAPGDEREKAPVWIGVDRVVRLLLQVVIAVLTILLVLGIWGTDRAAIEEILSRQLPGSTERTWADLVVGAIQVGLVFLAGRILRDILIFIVFPRRKTEVGTRYAIITVIRYAVIVVAVLVGAPAVGINMSVVTLFAGGAGIGLSFALQDILGNFFSGLIMLIERPVRVGDLIEVGGVGGQVEAIRLRGTWIRAWDKTSVIIPNRQMIGERLKNMTHGMEIARLEVAIGVSYGSDLDEVEKVLKSEGQSMPGVLADPGPVVRLAGFGDSSVDFQLFCFTDQWGDRYQIQHDLRKRVFDAFGRAGIEIPFPQRDLHIRSGERGAEPGGV